MPRSFTLNKSNGFNSMSHSIILKELNKIEVSDIMIPRSEVLLLDFKLSFTEIIDMVIKDGHSRFPVYSDKIDNIIGVLYVKDFLIFFTTIEVDFNISKILRKPLFVSENKKASELLSEFREAQVHMAIVVDEYGAMVGLISMEDILELIIGDINDEYDKKEENKNVLAINKDEYIINPKMLLEDFNKLMKTKINSNDYDTIGGFIIDKFGYVPKTGEILEYPNLVFNIKLVEGSKIKKIEVKKV